MQLLHNHLPTLVTNKNSQMFSGNFQKAPIDEIIYLQVVGTWGIPVEKNLSLRSVGMSEDC